MYIRLGFVEYSRARVMNADIEDVETFHWGVRCLCARKDVIRNGV